MTRLLINAVLSSLLLPSILACFQFGSCTNFGMCGGGCGGGGICRKVHGAKTVKDEEMPSTGDPDGDFRLCCKSSGLPLACLEKCNYRTFTRDALVGMFLNLDACPIEAANAMQRCAARGADHTDCCKRNAVHTTMAGDKCLLFCRADSQNATMLDITYLPCLDRFNSVNSCFWHDAVRETTERVVKKEEGAEQSDQGVEVMESGAKRRLREQREEEERYERWQAANSRVKSLSNEEYEEFEGYAEEK